MAGLVGGASILSKIGFQYDFMTGMWRNGRVAVLNTEDGIKAAIQWADGKISDHAYLRVETMQERARRLFRPITDDELATAIVDAIAPGWKE